MTKYREILRLASLGLSQQSIAERLYPSASKQISSNKKMPDFDYIRKELLRNGVNKKLLWTEYLEECRMSGEEPLMYSQFCYHIQQDEQKRHATMHIPGKPGEQIEVDWAGDPACITDPDTGEMIPAWLFVGVMTYSMYPYVEAFINEKQRAWITAHVHMYKYFGGVTRILVPDNTKTAVLHTGDWYTQELNTVYHEMAEHYNTAILPARVRAPKDKPNAEGSVGVISTWITAALRNEQFFSLAELNQAIREKLEEFAHRPFQKKEGSRYEIFVTEELPLLGKLPATRYELAEWKSATVQFNYHISVDGMLYSVPYGYIKRKVDVRITDQAVEIFLTIIESPLIAAGTDVRGSTAPSRSICRRITRNIWSGTATVSANGLNVSAAIRARSSMRSLPPRGSSSNPIAVVWDF